MVLAKYLETVEAKAPRTLEEEAVLNMGVAIRQLEESLGDRTDFNSLFLRNWLTEVLNIELP